jgi:hypothetical protein
MKQEKIRIKVSLSEEENQKLIACSEKCGLTQSEFIRQLCKGRTPIIKQSKEFWKLLNSLYDLHDNFKKCVPYYADAELECVKIEELLLQLQEV